MENIRNLRLKAEKDKLEAEQTIERLEQLERNEQLKIENDKIVARKLKADRLHSRDVASRQVDQDRKNYEKSSEARTARAYRDGQNKTATDNIMRLTSEEKAFKNLNWQSRLDCSDAIASGEVKDVSGFLKKQRIDQEASEMRRRRLKGL